MGNTTAAVGHDLECICASGQADAQTPCVQFWIEDDFLANFPSLLLAVHVQHAAGLARVLRGHVNYTQIY